MMTDKELSIKSVRKKEKATIEEEVPDLTFEDALAKLETHIRTLEQGELTLEQSLIIFEDGMKLAKFCTEKLNEAEQKIQILIEKDGKMIKVDFKPTEE